MPRQFIYDERTFPDPGEHLTPYEVRTSMVTFFPELSNAEIKGPRAEGDDQIYEFERRVGTKGVLPDEPACAELGCWPVAPLPENIVTVTLCEKDYRTLVQKAEEQGIGPSELVTKWLSEWKSS